MANNFYNPSGAPTTGAFAASAVMRGEFNNIGAGFDKLPTLSGLTIGRAVVVNSTGIALTVTTGTLALAGAFSLVGGHSLAITVNADAAVTFPTSGTLSTRAGVETLVNKTIDGGLNTLVNLGNGALTNSTVNINGTVIALGDTATVTAAAGTLTGGTLAAGVTASSLTSVGTLSTLTVSGALTYGGVTLSAVVTGTGSMVLSTSPTLTTPLLGTPTSGNLSNCTAFPAASLGGTTLASGVTGSSLTSVGTLGSLAVAGVTTISTNNAAPLMITRAAAGANVSIQISNNDGSWFVGKGSGGNFNVDTDSTIGTGPKLALTTSGDLSVASVTTTGLMSVGTTLGVTGATTLAALTINGNVTCNATTFNAGFTNFEVAALNVFGRFCTQTTTKNANFTLAATDTSIIVDNSSATTTATITSGLDIANTGRWLFIKTVNAQAVVSSASNVQPIGSISPGTAILPATAGAWAILQSDGSNWIVMARGT